MYLQSLFVESEVQLSEILNLEHILKNLFSQQS